MKYTFKERDWHKLTNEQRSEVFKKKPTVSEFISEFKQPSWCEYPEALSPIVGCWSLCKENTTVSTEFCKGCDQF